MRIIIRDDVIGTRHFDGDRIASWRISLSDALGIEPAEQAEELDSLSQSLPEWLSAEDEAAYGQLRPL
jgi:hypothetical protein